LTSPVACDALAVSAQKRLSAGFQMSALNSSVSLGFSHCVDRRQRLSSYDILTLLKYDY